MRELKSHFYQRLEQRGGRYLHFKVEDLTLAVKQKLTVYMVKFGPTLHTHKIYNYKDIELKFETKNNNRVDCSRSNLQLNWLIIIVAVCENSHIRQIRTNLVLGPLNEKTIKVKSRYYSLNFWIRDLKFSEVLIFI